VTLPVQDTLGMLSDNLRKRRSALPLSALKATAWARGLGIPRGGPVVLYTGQMFQMMPAINAMSRRLAKMENSWMAEYVGMARSLNKLVNLTGLMARGTAEDVRQYTAPLRNIAALLKEAGVAFGYLYEEDLYAGALAYDEGLDDTMRAHARFVYGVLKANGVREVITVDPHTLNMLKTVYPKVVDGYDLKVHSYLEVLAERGLPKGRDLGGEVTLHDSCIYARREGVLDQPRELLRQSGVRIREVDLSGKATQCCGGPAESLFPGKAHELAQKRMDQLVQCSPRIVTLCPLCLGNLVRVAPAGVTVQDISTVLTAARPASAPPRPAPAPLPAATAA
jgi:Fe-S oxidoreductase